MNHRCVQPGCTRFPESNVPKPNPHLETVYITQSFQAYPATAVLLFLTKISFKNNFKIIRRKRSGNYNTSTNVF